MKTLLFLFILGEAVAHLVAAVLYARQGCKKE